MRFYGAPAAAVQRRHLRFASLWFRVKKSDHNFPARLPRQISLGRYLGGFSEYLNPAHV